MRQFKKTMLIVCEGEGTEPDYFNELRNILIENQIEIAITIRPKPKKEQQIEEFQIRNEGKKRQLKTVNEDLKPEIEEEYKSQPVRYIREAQLGLEERTFDEVWAVFDKDEHPNPKKAFELASLLIHGKTVNIAFNSISFEHWILLHFEENYTAFQKSMCRIQEEHFYCGSNTHKNDCEGEKCVCGRIVSQNYLTYFHKKDKLKKEFEFKHFHPKVSKAIENAVKLFNSNSTNPNPIYEINPITTTYRLSFKLIQLAKSIDYQWFDFNQIQIFNKIRIEFKFENNAILLKMNNLTDSTIIINPDFFVLIDSQGNKVECGNRLLVRENEENIKIDLSDYQMNALFLGVKINENNFRICEIPK